jgi:hypothetical protein
MAEIVFALQLRLSLRNSNRVSYRAHRKRAKLVGLATLVFIFAENQNPVAHEDSGEFRVAGSACALLCFGLEGKSILAERVVLTGLPARRKRWDRTTSAKPPLFSFPVAVALRYG